jgi:hypothetical protein
VVPHSAKTYVFYTRSTAYKKQGALDRRSLIQQKLIFFTRVAPRTKKQGAPDRRSLIQQKFMLFTRVAPRTKSKGLLIGGPYIFYYFRHALRRAQKARGSIGICVKLVILVIKFPKKIADQRVSSSFSIIQTMSHQIPIGSSIYFSFTVVINIQEVRGIHLYLSASSSSSMRKKRLQSLRAVVVIGLSNTSKVI